MPNIDQKTWIFERLKPQKSSSRAGAVRFPLKRHVREEVPKKDQNESLNRCQIRCHLGLLFWTHFRTPSGTLFLRSQPSKMDPRDRHRKKQGPKMDPLFEPSRPKTRAQKCPKTTQNATGLNWHPKGGFGPHLGAIWGHFVVIWDHLGTNSGQFCLILNMHVFTLCISIRTLHATENPQANSPFWGRRGAKRFELLKHLHKTLFQSWVRDPNALKPV